MDIQIDDNIRACQSIGLSSFFSLKITKILGLLKTQRTRSHPDVKTIRAVTFSVSAYRF